MIYILNELSVKKFDSIYSGKIALEKFIITSIKAKEIGFDELRLHETFGHNLYSFILADDYLIQHWLNDNDVNCDLKDKFRELVTTSPLITNDELKELYLFNRSEFKISLNSLNFEVFGLGAAYLLETLSISFLSNSFWNNFTITISHYFIDEHNNEKTDNQSVKHISIAEHVEFHNNWIEQKKKDSLENSKALWDQRLDFFPELILCGDVEQQLTIIGQSKYLFQIIDNSTLRS